MNTNVLQQCVNNRSALFIIIYCAVFLSFMFSFAINNISIYLLIPLFFLDTKQNIRSKVLKLKNNRLIVLYTVFFLAQLAGLTYTENIAFGTSKVMTMLPMIFVPAIVSVEKLPIKTYDKIIGFLTKSIVAFFVYFIFVHVFIDGRSLNTFVHFTVEQKIGVSQFYLVFILFIPLLMSVLQLLSCKGVIVNFIVICFSIAILLLFGNKTILLSLVFLAFIILHKQFKTNKKTGVLLLLIIVSMAASALHIPIVKQKTQIFLKTTDLDYKTIVTKNRYTITKNTFEHRVLINYLSLKQIISSFPFGVGTGDYKDVLYDQYENIGFKAGLEYNLNNHNQYLSEFLKTGVIGGVLFFSIVIFLIGKIDISKPLYSYMVFFFAIACIVESYLDRQHGVVVFGFILPFFLINERNRSY